MDSKEIIKVLNVLRDLGDSYHFSTPSDFSQMSSKDQLAIYACLYNHLKKCNHAMGSIIELHNLVSGRN